MYGLNPSITNSTYANSPYYKNPCEFCKSNGCIGFIYNNEYNPDEKDEAEERFLIQAEMESELL